MKSTLKILFSKFLKNEIEFLIKDSPVGAPSEHPDEYGTSCNH